ncbi:MAG: sigma-70 family RNA polymerase sigma factor [Ilumatobacteraceae bacterium]
MTDDEYDELFRTSYPRLVAMGLSTSTERHVVQDLAQETMFRAYRHRDRLAAYDAPLGWCRRVMGNLLIDHHRSLTAERAAVDKVSARAATSISSSASDPAAALVSTPWSELVELLTPQQRLIATLYYAQDQSVTAIADELKISHGTVKSTLAKARANVRRRLGFLHGTIDNEERS